MVPEFCNMFYILVLLRGSLKTMNYSPKRCVLVQILESQSTLADGETKHVVESYMVT